MNDIKVIMDLDYAIELYKDLNVTCEVAGAAPDTVTELMDALYMKIEEVSMRAHYEITVHGRTFHFCGSIETAVAYVDEHFSEEDILEGNVRIKAVDQFNQIIEEYKEVDLHRMIFNQMVSEVNRKSGLK